MKQKIYQQRNAEIESKTGHGAFTYERLLWDIPEIFAAKDVEAAHFKKILRVQKAVLISNTDTCRSLANEP